MYYYHNINNGVITLINAYEEITDDEFLQKYDMCELETDAESGELISNLKYIFGKYSQFTINKLITTEIVQLIYGNKLLYEMCPHIQIICINHLEINNNIIDRINKYMPYSLYSSNRADDNLSESIYVTLENFLKSYPKNIIDNLISLYSYYSNIGNLNLKNLSLLGMIHIDKFYFDKFYLNLPNLLSLRISKNMNTELNNTEPNINDTNNYTKNIFKLQHGENCDLPKLRTIDIRYPILELSVQLPELSVITLEQTKLKNIGYISAPNLTDINIESSDDMTTIFAEKCDIKNLKTLNIGAKNILNIAESPEYIVFNLQKLYISRCEKIAQIIGDCEYFDFKHLITLNINNSFIQNFNIKCSPEILFILKSTVNENTFLDYTNAEDIMLSNTNIALNMTLSLPKLKKIDIKVDDVFSINFNNYPNLIDIRIIKN